MDKIYINKSDNAVAVIGKIIKAKGSDLILYIPREAQFASSRNNFLLLKREARAAKKNVVIESVDDDVLELAATSGFRASDPFLGKKKKPVSDIVSVHDSLDDAGGGGEDMNSEEEPIGENGDIVPSEEETVLKARRGRGRRERIKTVRQSAAPGRRRVLFVSAIAVFLAASGFLAAMMLPRAGVKLVFEKTPFEFMGSAVASTNATSNALSDSEVVLQAIGFLEKKNLTKTYQATGEKFVEKRSKGKIIVWNAFNAEPQTLIATTRFSTPEGKIYRTDEKVTVPAARMENGKLIPASVEVSVTADAPGEEYNIGPVSKFRIPGFQGSPRYDGFYGESKESMSGGAIGNMKVPTESDIASARADLHSSLGDAVKTQLLSNIPSQNIKILDGAYSFKVIEESIDETADASGMFKATAYGEGKFIAFRESDIISVFEGKVRGDFAPNLVPREMSIEYGEPVFSDDREKITVPIKIVSVWTEPFDVDGFKNAIKGKTESELNGVISSIPGVVGGEVRLRPFWVRKVPNNSDRISVDVE